MWNTLHQTRIRDDSASDSATHVSHILADCSSTTRHEHADTKSAPIPLQRRQSEKGKLLRIAIICDTLDKRKGNQRQSGSHSLHIWHMLHRILSGAPCSHSMRPVRRTVAYLLKAARFVCGLKLSPACACRGQLQHGRHSARSSVEPGRAEGGHQGINFLKSGERGIWQPDSGEQRPCHHEHNLFLKQPGETILMLRCADQALCEVIYRCHWCMQ